MLSTAACSKVMLNIVFLLNIVVAVGLHHNASIAMTMAVTRLALLSKLLSNHANHVRNIATQAGIIR